MGTQASKYEVAPAPKLAIINPMRLLIASIAAALGAADLLAKHHDNQDVHHDGDEEDTAAMMSTLEVEAPSPLLSEAGTQTEASQTAMTPEEALGELKAGNQRFARGLMTNRDYLAQAEDTAEGQHPFAIVLGCVDSRAPVEIIFDQGIGDIFCARVAGNVAPDDVIGSMEFATAAAGSKVIMVMGHTSCGAVKGAVDDVELGRLSGLLDQIQPAIEQTELKEGEIRSSASISFVDRVAVQNVRNQMAEVLEKSPVITGLVESGEVIVAGGMYDLQTGLVTFIED
jgi:carbonic anhydrase